jgi:hypothetical protein
LVGSSDKEREVAFFQGSQEFLTCNEVSCDRLMFVKEVSR